MEISTEKVKVGGKRGKEGNEGILTMRMADLHVVNPKMFYGKRLMQIDLRNNHLKELPMSICD